MNGVPDPSLVVSHAARSLPVQLTSFVGRDDEVHEVAHLVSQRRLVTLTGMGGVGKTRLAMAVAEAVAQRYADGVCFVDLGAVTDPQLVPHLVGSAMGVAIKPDAEPVSAVASASVEHDRLLILDTCEHLLDATAALSEALLRLCPSMSILATSREPLGVTGETTWRTPSLKAEDAERLFVERALLVAPRFDPGPVAADISRICTRVDHIPLAVELAGAWVRALTPRLIAEGLEDSLRLLSGGPRGAVARHRTLSGSISWSYALLAPEEQELFRRLSVFAGPFPLSAVVEVCGDGLSTSPSADRTPHAGGGPLRLLSRLVDASLVTVGEVRGETRYRMLDTIRHFAEDLLTASGEAAVCRDRLLRFYLGLVERGSMEDADGLIDLVESHRDNLSAALAWGLTAPAEQAEETRQLAAALAPYWFLRGRSAEGLAMLQRALSLAPAEPSPVEARLWAGLAMVAVVSGRRDTVSRAARLGMKIAQETGDDATRARCLALAAYPAFFDDFARCEAMAAEAIEAGDQAGDGFARDWAGVLAGYSMLTRGRHTEAVAIARRVNEMSRQRRDRFCAAFALDIDQYVAMVTGDLPRAVVLGRAAVDMARPLGDYFAVGTTTVNAAYAVAFTGRLDEAHSMMEPIVRSVTTASEVDVVGFMVPYGHLHLLKGELETAVYWLSQGADKAADRLDWTAARALPPLADALRRLGRVEEAARRAEEAVRSLRQFGAPFELAAALDVRARLAGHGSRGRARTWHLEALVMRSNHGIKAACADSIDALAALHVDAGDYTEATRLLATSEAAREELEYPRPPVDLPAHDATVDLLRERLGDEEFTAVWSEGRARSLDEVVATAVRGWGPRGHRPSSGWASLTPTEREVVTLIVEGQSNPEVAARLYMSRSTVKAHLSHIFAKLGVTNRTELAAVVAARDTGAR